MTVCYRDMKGAHLLRNLLTHLLIFIILISPSPERGLCLLKYFSDQYYLEFYLKNAFIYSLKLFSMLSLFIQGVEPQSYGNARTNS